MLGLRSTFRVIYQISPHKPSLLPSGTIQPPSHYKNTAHSNCLQGLIYPSSIKRFRDSDWTIFSVLESAGNA